MLKLPNKLLVRLGILLAVSLAMLSLPLNQVSADEPLETRIVQAIEIVGEEVQKALVELGELDTPEKADEAGRILHQRATAKRELNKKLHSRASDRFDELNDLAIALGRRGHDLTEANLEQAITGLRQQAEAKLASIKELDTPGQTERAKRIRIALERRIEQFQAQVQNRVQAQVNDQVQGRVQHEAGDRFDSQAQAQGLRNKARAALEELVELDTPEKQGKARQLKARLNQALGELKQRLGNQINDRVNNQASNGEFEGRFEAQAQGLREKARAALAELGELNTPEKQEKARQLKARLDRALAELKQRLGSHVKNQANGEAEGRIDAQVQELRDQAIGKLRQLGVLDNLKKMELTRQITARMDGAINRLRRQGRQGHRENLVRFDDHRDRGPDGRATGSRAFPGERSGNQNQNRDRDFASRRGGSGEENHPVRSHTNGVSDGANRGPAVRELPERLRNVRRDLADTRDHRTAPVDSGSVDSKADAHESDASDVDGSATSGDEIPDESNDAASGTRSDTSGGD